MAALLGTSAIATLAMGFASQVGFRRDFLAFLNEQGLERVDALVPKVVALYQRGGNWDYLHTNPRLWFDAVGIPGAGPTLVPNVSPSTLQAGFHDLNVDVTGTGIRLTLLNAQRQFIIGYPDTSSDSTYRELDDHAQQIGWLVFTPVRKVSNLAQSRFQRRELLLTLVAGGMAICAAALMMAGLSNALLGPLRRIGAVTRRLAAGDYSARVTPYAQDEVGRLAVDVNHLALALERNESMRRNLMADVSHELRTPLAVLSAELEALWDGVRSLSRDSLASLLAEVTTLNKLVNDLHELAIADVGALSYRKEVVDVGYTLKTCVAAFRERMELQELTVELLLDRQCIWVMADESRLQQLFNNLLENAICYTERGGRIRVTGDQSSTKAHIRVEDSPPGVASQHLPHLFDRFYRVDATRARNAHGSGLGLAVCRSITEAHDGRIVASVSTLGGLQIDLELPRAME